MYRRSTLYRSMQQIPSAFDFFRRRRSSRKCSCARPLRGLAREQDGFQDGEANGTWLKPLGAGASFCLGHGCHRSRKSAGGLAENPDVLTGHLKYVAMGSRGSVTVGARPGCEQWSTRGPFALSVSYRSLRTVTRT